MVKFNLITGFLGSGKTTLLKNLLRELSKTSRIAVIQNEFASSSIDGKELKQENEYFKLIEINNGSLFCLCQLKNFEKVIEALLTDYNPEAIFLEASGLSDPVSIAELLQSPSLLGRITLDKLICLVDAENFYKGLNKLVRFNHQIMIADMVIINKIDLFKGDIKVIEKQITQINPFAKIVPAVYANISWDLISETISKKGTAAKRFTGRKSEGRPAIKACVLRVHDKFDIAALNLFITRLQKKCLRIKGFINMLDGSTVLVQSVYNNFEYRTVTGYSGRTEIIAFGENIEVAELRKELREVSTSNSVNYND